MGTNMTEQTVNLLSETKKVKDELTKAMEQKKTLNHTIERMRYIETRMKMAQDPERKESILDKTFFKDLNDEITAAEKHVNNLTMEKENLRQNISQYERQMQIWQSIIIILSSKSKSAEENKQSNGILLRKSGAETLILE
ncbi:hypothetical protein KM043_016478 [Ampulex compressa]|nr:hypothetical protein KM043_016478 [Ampulex compressa]